MNRSKLSGRGFLHVHKGIGNGRMVKPSLQKVLLLTFCTKVKGVVYTKRLHQGLIYLPIPERVCIMQQVRS